jgi:hypothetical protein
MIVATLYGLPETLPAADRRPGGIRQMALRARELFADPRFRNPVLVQCVTVCGFFTYIGGSSFVLQHDLGISQQAYALVFAVNALAMVTSSVIYRLLVLRTGPYVLRALAVVVQTVSVTALFTVTLATPRPPPSPRGGVALPERDDAGPGHVPPVELLDRPDPRPTVRGHGLGARRWTALPRRSAHDAAHRSARPAVGRGDVLPPCSGSSPSPPSARC